MTIVADNKSQATSRTPLKGASEANQAGSGSNGQFWTPPPPVYSAIAPTPRNTREEHYVRYARRNPCRRFCKAFAIGVLLWLLANGIFKAIAAWADTSYGYPSGHSLDHCVGGDGDHWLSSVLPDVIDESSSGYYPRHVRTSFDLPIDSSTLFVISRGSNSGGRATINTSPSLQHDIARVDVRVTYWREDVLRRVRICSVTRGPDEKGVGLFTPNRWLGGWNSEDRIKYFINITLPQPSSPLLVNNFETDLPNHSHALGDLNKTVRFDQLSLKSTNGGFNIKSLDFRKGTIKTTNGGITSGAVRTEDGHVVSTNGAIRGSFNATDRLVLQTTNGAIQAHVKLANTNGISSSLTLRTTNGRISSNVDLLAGDNDTPVFDVRATTTNSRHDLVISSLPVDSALNLRTSTTNERHTVRLPTTFEGAYSLSTTHGSPNLRYNTGVEDPAGRGRQRSIITRQQTKDRLTGSVFWGSPSGEKGTVTMHTTNGNINLNL